MNSHLKKLMICLIASASAGCLLAGCKSSHTNVHYNKAENTVSVTQTPSYVAKEFSPLNHKIYSQRAYSQMVPSKRYEPTLIYRFINNNIYIQAVQPHTKNLTASINKSYEQNSSKVIKRAPKSKRSLVGAQVLQSYRVMIKNAKDQNHIYSRIHITSIHHHKKVYTFKGREYEHSSDTSQANSPKPVKLTIQITNSGMKLISYNGTHMHHNKFTTASDKSTKNLLTSSHISNSHLGY